MAIIIVVAALALARGLNMAVFHPEGGKDFQWSGSRTLLDHRNPYAEYQEYRQGLREKPFILTQAPNYPASGYVFLWPFAALEWSAAKAAWAVANVFFTIAIIAGLQKLWPLPDRRLVVIATCLLLIATCYRAILSVGQHSLFSLSFFIWSLVWVERRRTLAAGLLLAVSWFKYTITFPLTFILLTKKKYSVVLIAGTVHVILLGLVSWWIRQPPQDFVLQPVGVAMAGTRGYMDVFGTMQRLGLHQSIPALLSIVLFVLSGLGSMFFRSKNDLITLSLLALISYTIFSHRWFDNVVFIFPLWYCMMYGLTQPLGKLFCVLLILAWYTAPLVALVQVVQQHVGAPYLTSWLTSSLYAMTLVLLYGTLGYLIYLQLGSRVRSGRATIT